eukprot:TRINITY_DN3706_c0_g1_i1.p1 TRINITY_DN3706_c0_g1~~TRINITY_DN3706_c0_g1_i1.p1  ORF type:complete len:149 (+),score=37.15 TRINITY_DN3706_c0_g1_i1:17-463(+)
MVELENAPIKTATPKSPTDDLSLTYTTVNPPPAQNNTTQNPQASLQHRRNEHEKVASTGYEAASPRQESHKAEATQPESEAKQNFNEPTGRTEDDGLTLIKGHSDVDQRNIKHDKASGSSPRINTRPVLSISNSPIGRSSETAKAHRG